MLKKAITACLDCRIKESLYVTPPLLQQTDHMKTQTVFKLTINPRGNHWKKEWRRFGKRYLALENP